MKRCFKSIAVLIGLLMSAQIALSVPFRVDRYTEAYWSCDENQGNVATDLSENHHVLRLSNGATWGEARSGESGFFMGNRNGMIRGGTIANGWPALTLEFSFQLANIGDREMYIISRCRWHDEGDPSFYAIVVQNRSLYCGIYLNQPRQGYVSLSTDPGFVENNTWYDVQLSWSDGQPLRLVLNGEYITRSQNVGNGVVRTGDDALMVGNENVERYGDFPLVNGLIDEIRISRVNRFLLEEEDEDPEFHWEFTSTDNSMMIVVDEAIIDGEELERGDQIGVFTPEDICAGVVIIEEDGFPAGFAAWGDDDVTEEIDGFQADEELQFRLWDASEECEVATEAEIIRGELNYETNSGVVVSLDSHPQIELDRNSVGFGEVEPMEVVENTLTICNEGHTDLIISELVIEDDVFGLPEDEDQIILEPYQDYDLIVSFSPEECGDFDGILTIVSNDPDNEETVVELHGSSTGSMLLPLQRGWNMISSPVAPIDDDLTVILQDMIDRENLIIIKDGIGHFSYPIDNFNNIEGWDFRYGYKVKVESDDTLSIFGSMEEVDTPIPLSQGWQIVSYLPENQLHYSEAFESIEDELLFVRDAEGRFAWIEIGFSNMDTPMQRGQGYFVKVSEDAELVYSSEERVANEGHEKNQPYPLPSHFVPEMRTQSCMNIVIEWDKKSNCRSPNSHPELGVFTVENKCIGSVSLAGNGPWGIAV
ncbi:MAG: hypothetical protein HN757_16010, partial [Calditrichaeota bacterium]|nr:hypothetical protein [Calditrichota bacterium]